MAQVSRNQPLIGIDEIGKPNIGTQVPDKPKGSKWEMGVAVPVKNRKFERGTPLEYRVAGDSFDKNYIAQNDSHFGIEAPQPSPGNTPSNFIQYGDKAMLGLSSHASWPNHSEFIRVAGVGEILSSLTTWQRGEIFPLDRANRFKYQFGDKVTIYGTGCADNWVPHTNQLMTLGIQKGISSLNRLGMYKPQIGQVSMFEADMADDYLAFEIELPSHSSYTSNANSGVHSRAWGKLGLLPFRSKDVFDSDGFDWFYETGNNSGLFRFMLSKNTDDKARALYSSDAPSQLSLYTIRISGGTNVYLIKSGTNSRAAIGDIVSTGRQSSRLEFGHFLHQLPYIAIPDITIPDITISDGAEEVVISFGGDTVGDWLGDPLGFASVIASAINSEANFAVSAQVPSLEPAGYPFYLNIFNKEADSVGVIDFGEQVDTPLILGFNHPGGETTDYAQSLLSIASQANNKNAGFYENVGILSQVIKPLSPRYPALVGDTKYRLGVTWKGSLQAEGASSANLAGSQFFVGFRWNPLVGEGDYDHYANSMMSTEALLDENNLDQPGWKTNLVTSEVRSVELDSLSDNGFNRIDIVLKSRGQDSYIDNSGGRGVELMAFVDQVWLEHQGDIPGADNGCVALDHYPSQATLGVNRRLIQEDEVLTMANGQQFNVSSVLMGDKRRYEIDADFLNVPLSIYDQFRALLRWQDKGYHLTLHPYLPGVPHCLIGRMEITNEQKNHWDLTRYTFHFKFIEQD